MLANNQRYAFLFLFFLVISLSGCDVINTIKEDYFSKDTSKKEKKTTPKTTAPKTTPVTQAPQKTKTPPKQVTKGPLPKNVVVRIGDWTVTVDDFNQRLTALKEVVPDFDMNDVESKKLVLEELIRQQLLVFDAEKKGIADSKDIKAAVEEFRRTLIVREMAQKLTEKITVSEEEMRAFYEERKVDLIEPVEYSISEIVLETQLKANEVLIEILKGQSFAEMAKQHSTSESALNGGSLGVIEEVPFPEMADEILSMEEGDVSKVLKGPDGFYIIKLDKKAGGKQVPFEDIKEEIQQNRILVKQQQVILDYIKGLEESMKIEKNESLIE